MRYNRLLVTNLMRKQHQMRQMIPPESEWLIGLFQPKCGQITVASYNPYRLFVQIKRYFEGRVVDRKEDPLDWWKRNGQQFSHLAVVAQRFYAIPSSSVPSEQLFSKAGELISQRRCQLKPKNVDILVFLNKNL